VGNIVQNLKSGRGVLIGENSLIYEGNFEADKKHGKGKEYNVLTQ